MNLPEELTETLPLLKELLLMLSAEEVVMVAGVVLVTDDGSGPEVELDWDTEEEYIEEVSTGDEAGWTTVLVSLVSPILSVTRSVY